MQAFHFDAQPLILPPGHRFPHHKYAALRERLERALPQLRLQAAPRAALPALRAVHTEAYVQRVLDGSLSAAEQREIGCRCVRCIRSAPRWRPRGRRCWRAWP